MTTPTEPPTTTTDETIATWLKEPDPIHHVTSHIRGLESANLALAGDLRRARHQADRYKKELERERQRANLAERQAAGVDEDAFDPAKQKGAGAIPVGGDFRAIEDIEALYGMGPTLDQKIAELGADAVRQLAAKNPDAMEVALDQLPRLMFGRVLQIVWAARTMLSRSLEDDEADAETDEASALVIEAIEGLPMRWFEEYLDLHGWDMKRVGLPPLREARKARRNHD